MARYRTKKQNIIRDHIWFLWGLLTGIALGLLMLFLLQKWEAHQERAGKEPLSVAAETSAERGRQLWPDTGSGPCGRSACCS